MKKLDVFAVFGILFLSSILLANGMYSNSISVIAQQENEAEVNADIKEQENKCTKETECENENKINNSLAKTTITQNSTQIEEPATSACEECFSILSQQSIDSTVSIYSDIVSSETGEDPNLQTLEDLCNFLASTTTYENEAAALGVALGSNSVPQEQIDSILQCLADLGLVVLPD